MFPAPSFAALAGPVRHKTGKVTKTIHLTRLPNLITAGFQPNDYRLSTEFQASFAAIDEAP